MLQAPTAISLIILLYVEPWSSYPSFYLFATGRKHAKQWCIMIRIQSLLECALLHDKLKKADKSGPQGEGRRVLGGDWTDAGEMGCLETGKWDIWRN